MTLNNATGLPVSMFKGRGAFSLLLRQATAQQAELHMEMEALAVSSKIAGSPLYLQRHIELVGVWRLRWRIKLGSRDYRHVLWADLREPLAALPLAISKHCIALNKRAHELNTLDLILQHTITRCSKFLDGHADKNDANVPDRNPRA